MSEQNMNEQDAVTVETFQYADENALAKARALADAAAIEKAQRTAKYTANVVKVDGKYRAATAEDDPAQIVKVTITASLNKTRTGYRKFRATFDNGAKIENADLRSYLNNRVAFSPTVFKTFRDYFAGMGMIESGYRPAAPASLNVGF